MVLSFGNNGHLLFSKRFVIEITPIKEANNHLGDVE
jgi:lipid-A-disaccharide synthase-like uncharacterized protein